MAGPIHQLGGDEYQLLMEIAQYGHRVHYSETGIKHAIQRAVAQSQLRPDGRDAADYYSLAVRWTYTASEYDGASRLASTLLRELGSNAYEDGLFYEPPSELELQHPGGRKHGRNGGGAGSGHRVHVVSGGTPADHSLKVQISGRRLGQQGSALLRASRRMRALRSRHVHPRLR